MDLLCPKCGEPWDTDNFHDIYNTEVNQSIVRREDLPPRRTLLTFKHAISLFKAYGCKVFGWNENCGKRDFPDRGLISAIYELEGDDIDGAACDFEDLFSK